MGGKCRADESWTEDSQAAGQQSALWDVGQGGTRALKEAGARTSSRRGRACPEGAGQALFWPFLSLSPAGDKTAEPVAVVPGPQHLHGQAVLTGI